jgi:hypothetical protein
VLACEKKARKKDRKSNKENGGEMLVNTRHFCLISSLLIGWLAARHHPTKRGKRDNCFSYFSQHPPICILLPPYNNYCNSFVLILYLHYYGVASAHRNQEGVRRQGHRGNGRRNCSGTAHVASTEQLLISSLIFVPSTTLDSGSAPQGEALCELEADRRHHQDQGALEAQQGLPVGTFWSLCNVCACRQ